jgi:hypothetical protein
MAITYLANPIGLLPYRDGCEAQDRRDIFDRPLEYRGHTRGIDIGLRDFLDRHSSRPKRRRWNLDPRDISRSDSARRSGWLYSRSRDLGQMQPAVIGLIGMPGG